MLTCPNKHVLAHVDSGPKVRSQPRYSWGEAIVWELLVEPSSGHQRAEKDAHIAERFLRARPKAIQCLPYLLKGRGCIS